MLIRTPRTQRGITLIEIILVMAIVVAATVAVFVFSKKATVTAAVETEQRQVEQITKTVQGLFATQTNFAALGTNGASYLKDHAARSGLKFTTQADGTPTMETGLGDGRGTLTIAAADIGYAATGPAPAGTANGFVLAYDGLKPAECIGLVTATAASTAKTKIGHDGVLPGEGIGQVALNGRLAADKGKIADSCKEQGSARPTVFLFFAPARSIAAAGAPTPTPAAACNPVHETQLTACPAGQVGTVTQERHGTCTGPNNAMVYTIWSTTDDTCQAAPVAPPGQTTTDPGEQCGKSKFTRAVACPSGQVGQVAQSREVDTCDGTDTGWQAVPGGNSCQTAPAATCVPQTQSRILTCPAGQGGGEIVQARSSTCSSPSAAPDWTPDPLPPGFDSQGWQTTSNTCTASCIPTGTCCTVQRAVRPSPCATGTYGSAGEQEHFLGCVNATTQSGAWTAWQDSVASSCTACPATTTDTETKWVPRSKVCPAGETGSNTWEAQQTRTQKTSYSCPAGTTTLPAPTTSAWSVWTDTGATRNTVNTCAPTPAAGSGRICTFVGADPAVSRAAIVQWYTPDDVRHANAVAQGNPPTYFYNSAFGGMPVAAYGTYEGATMPHWVATVPDVPFVFGAPPPPEEGVYVTCDSARLDTAIANGTATLDMYAREVLGFGYNGSPDVYNVRVPNLTDQRANPDNGSPFVVQWSTAGNKPADWYTPAVARAAHPNACWNLAESDPYMIHTCSDLYNATPHDTPAGMTRWSTSGDMLTCNVSADWATTPKDSNGNIPQTQFAIECPGGGPPRAVSSRIVWPSTAGPLP